MKFKQTVEKEISFFTLNKTNGINGSRRLVREKVLQILVAYFVSGTNIDLLIKHIYNRNFIIDENTKNKSQSISDVVLINEEKLININSDVEIKWRQRDMEFGRCIINSVIGNYDDFVNYIKEASENWEYERIAIVDRVIILMAVAEFIFAIDVPVKVTINESLELAKIYSTDKASIFVNGMLEKIKLIISQKGLINKSEQGLIATSKSKEDKQ
jgi:N utilization substance protein B